MTGTAQARKWLEVNHTAIALIQEPWVSGGRIRGLFNLGELVVVSAYMPEDEDPPSHDLARLVDYCEYWAGGSEPTFVTKRCKTIIDLTLATNKARDHIKDWHVSTEASCSDHRWIRFKIQVNIPPIPPSRNPRKTDTAKYKKLLDQRLAGFLLQRETCPLTTTADRPPGDNKWWGPELERLRGKVRKCLNRAMNTSTDRDWDAYKAAKSKYKKRLRYRSTASWRKFCSSITTFEQANRVRKVLSQQPQNDVGSLRKPDGSYTSSPDEANRLLLETHFPGCEIVQEVNWQETNTNIVTTQDWEYAQKQEAAAAAVRLNSLNLWRNNNTPHTAILNEAQTDLPLLAAAGDRIPKQFVFDKKYKIQLHEDDLYEGLTPKELRIFTDGSKTKSGTGSGVFSEDLNIRLSTPLGYHNSVFQAECMAISLATTAIAARK
ncbi:hypothetical protein NE865_04265 [Phthorimaea operculella]|nr:hypothetical protein NE865_04265 [Phthorimaea operculella]